MKSKVMVGIAALLVIAGIMTVSAQGRPQSRGGFDARPGFDRSMPMNRGGSFGGPRGMMGSADAGEEIEVSGTLQLAAGQVPKLAAGGTTYELMLPPALTGQVTVQNNQRITVKGWAVSQPSFDLLTTTNRLMVRELQVGTNRYILPSRR